MAKDVQELKDDVKDIKVFMSSLNEKLERRFANKWVEQTFAGLIVIFALATLYYIFNHVGLPKP